MQPFNCFASWRHSKDLGQVLLANDGSELGRIAALFEVGDRCRTVRVVAVRETENLQSDDVVELPAGAFLLVTDVGVGGQHLKVAGFGFEGWVTCQTRHGDRPIILLPDGRRSQELHDAAPVESVADILAKVFAVGRRYLVNSAVTIRTTESLQSDFVTELTAGTAVKIIKLSGVEGRRAKVLVGSIEGWLSLVTRKGELLLEAESVETRHRYMPTICSHFRHLNAARCVHEKHLVAPTALEESLAFATIADFRSHEQKRLTAVMSLPTFEFGAISCVGCSVSSKFEPTCSICLQDLSTGDKVKQLPCDHVFHAACVDRWLEKSDACPLRCHASICEIKQSL